VAFIFAPFLSMLDKSVLKCSLQVYGFWHWLVLEPWLEMKPVDEKFKSALLEE
jgi:hypothetical protein